MWRRSGGPHQRSEASTVKTQRNAPPQGIARRASQTPLRKNESRPEERISGLLVCSRPALQSGSLLAISQPYLLSRADSTCHAAGASCLRMAANQEGGRPQTGLFQPFATVPTSCLVVSQHEDMAVFHDIAVDIVVRGAVVPDSAIAGYSRDGFCGDVPGDDVQVEMPAHVIGLIAVKNSPMLHRTSCAPRPRVNAPPSPVRGSK